MSEDKCGLKELKRFTEDDLLPLSRLADVEFCERRAALHLVEQVWHDNVHTAGGTVLHEKVHSELPTESRKDIRIARGLLIHSFRLGLSGKTDVVEFHRTEQAPGVPLPGVEGLWLPFPVEYKPGRQKVQMSFRIQLCAQGLCLEEMLKCQIPRGFLYYGRSKRRMEVAFDRELRTRTEAAALRLHEIVRMGKTPPAKYEEKCKHCSLFAICMPKSAGVGKSAKAYLRRVLSDCSEEEP